MLNFLKMLITLMIGFFLYIIKGFGGGDIKLFTVIAIFLNIEELFLCFCISMVISFSIGIIKICVKRNLRQRIHFAVPVMLSVIFITCKSFM